MALASTVIELAAVAHRLWCEDMVTDGWRHGPRFDEAERTHDALVPFDQLGRHDRRHAVLAVECSGIAERLADLIDHPRGPDREFTTEEMRTELPVTLSPRQGEAAPAERGAIVSWETDEGGDLRLIRVRWSDGDLSEHHPAARELRRV